MSSGRSRLLLLSDWFTPGYRAGGPIRSTANLVAALQDRLDISVATSDRDFGTHEPYAGLPRNEWVSHGGAARVIYLSPDQLNSEAFRRIVDDVMPDCTYLNSMFSQPFTVGPLWLRWRGAWPGSMVLAPRGMLMEGALALKAFKKRVFLTGLRASGVCSSLHFHATDETERADIVRRLGVTADRVTTLPNFPEPPAATVRAIPKAAGHLDAMCLSRVSPKKNLLYAIERMRELPSDIRVRLTIAGPVEDREYWRACERAIAALPGHVRVELRGAVPHDDVRGLLEAHHVSILPTLGENYGHGIIESFAAGRPVIISDRTPWGDLATKGIGWDLPLENPAGFTAAIEAAARLDQDGFDRMCGASLAFARAQASPDALADRYVEMFSRATG